MRLTELHIINFKSIATASCSFAGKLNCFIGLNGSGKTNLLDALHYLSFTKSHLGITDALAIRQGEEQAVLDARYEKQDGQAISLLLNMRPGHRKILKRNKKEYDRLSQHIGQFPLVIVSPEDDKLIYGGSEERRRFLDHQLSQQDSEYMNALVGYHRALTQRNALLKDHTSPSALLEVLDLQLDRYGSVLYQKRAKFVKAFIPQFQQYYTAISDDQERVELHYRSHLASGERLMDQLQASRSQDLAIGYTTRGVHKDELEMSLSGELIRRIGSQGQRKTFLISLKLAQYTLLAYLSQESPILLLDDVFDRLDADRVERIIGLVGGEDFGQIFVTDTNRKYLDEIVSQWGKDYKLFSVQNGKISDLQASMPASSISPTNTVAPTNEVE